MPMRRARVKAHDRHHMQFRNTTRRHTKKQARVSRACLNSNELTSGDDANGGANADANELRSSKPWSFPGSQWRWRDLPTTAPGLAEPERQGPIPHQLQRGPELSSSSLYLPFSDRMPCQRATRPTQLAAHRSADRKLEVATSIVSESLRQQLQCMACLRVPYFSARFNRLLKT